MLQLSSHTGKPASGAFHILSPLPGIQGSTGLTTQLLQVCIDAIF